MFQNTSQVNSVLEKQVIVKNPTDKQLSWKWDGQTYTLNPQSEEYVPYWLGQHLVKHLGRHGVIMDETTKVQCGVCQKEFSTKRELGAHSLVHKDFNKKEK